MTFVRDLVSVYSVSLGKTERYFQSFDWLDKFMDYAEDMSDLRILKRMPENFTMSSVGTFDGGYAGASRPTATVDERPITKGKRVSVVDPRSPYGGFEGEVTGLEDNGIVIITLDTGAMIGVFLSQVTVKA